MCKREPARPCVPASLPAKHLPTAASPARRPPARCPFNHAGSRWCRARRSARSAGGWSPRAARWAWPAAAAAAQTAGRAAGCEAACSRQAASCHLAPRLASVLPAPSSSALANLALHSKDKCRSNQRAQERRNQAQVLPPKTVPLPPVHLSSSAQLAPAPAEARPTTCSPTVRLRAPSSSTSITDWRLRGEAGTVMEGL